MLIYCFEPLRLPFKLAVPALVHAIDSGGQGPLVLLGGGKKPAMDAFGAGSCSQLDIGAISHGEPVEKNGQVTIPIQCSSEDPTLMSVAGEVTLTRLSSKLCHLSLSTSITGRLAPGVMHNRGFQMALELAIAGFLEGLARTVAVIASLNGETNLESSLA